MIKAGEVTRDFSLNTNLVQEPFHSMLMASVRS